MFQVTLRQKTLQMGQHSVAIKMAAPLQYLLITVTGVALEKITFSNTQNPKAVC